jgi:hypothetical protein
MWDVCTFIYFILLQYNICALFVYYILKYFVPFDSIIKWTDLFISFSIALYGIEIPPDVFVDFVSCHFSCLLLEDPETFIHLLFLLLQLCSSFRTLEQFHLHIIQVSAKNFPSQRRLPISKTISCLHLNSYHCPFQPLL